MNEAEVTTETQETVVPPRQPSPPPSQTAPPAKPEAPSRAALVEMGRGGIMLRNLEDLIGFAAQVVRGGAAPDWAYGGLDPDQEPTKAFERARGAVAIAIQAGLEHGLGVLGGLQAFMVLDGNLSWKAEYAAGKIRNSPVCKPGTLKFWCEGTGDKRKGVAVAWRIGYEAPDIREFTFEQARTANLLNKFNWKSYPDRMYQWRALGWLAKDLFSDVLGNIPLAEEVLDFQGPERPTSTKAPIVAGAASVRSLPPASAPDPLFEEIKTAPAPRPEQVPVRVAATSQQAIETEARPVPEGGIPKVCPCASPIGKPGAVCETCTLPIPPSPIAAVEAPPTPKSPAKPRQSKLL